MAGAMTSMFHLSVPPDPAANPTLTPARHVLRATPDLVTSALSEEPIGFRQVYLAIDR
jgi:hypothetical protein